MNTNGTTAIELQTMEAIIRMAKDLGRIADALEALTKIENGR